MSLLCEHITRPPPPPSFEYTPPLICLVYRGGTIARGEGIVAVAAAVAVVAVSTQSRAGIERPSLSLELKIFTLILQLY